MVAGIAGLHDRDIPSRHRTYTQFLGHIHILRVRSRADHDSMSAVRFRVIYRLLDGCEALQSVLVPYAGNSGDGGVKSLTRKFFTRRIIFRVGIDLIAMNAHPVRPDIIEKRAGCGEHIGIELVMETEGNGFALIDNLAYGKTDRRDKTLAVGRDITFYLIPPDFQVGA